MYRRSSLLNFKYKKPRQTKELPLSLVLSLYHSTHFINYKHLLQSHSFSSSQKKNMALSSCFLKPNPSVLQCHQFKAPNSNRGFRNQVGLIITCTWNEILITLTNVFFFCFFVVYMMIKIFIDDDVYVWFVYVISSVWWLHQAVMGRGLL